MSTEARARDHLSIGLCAHIACMWEATARKPGNVHPSSDFTDTTYNDFLLSAAAVAPVFDIAAERSVGNTILDAIRATRRVVSRNTNLGIVLLLAPLAAVPCRTALTDGIHAVLANLSVLDSCAVYEAIRLASPGGMARVDEQDVATTPTQSLQSVMALAANRDSIALQYTNGFQDIFHDGTKALNLGLRQTGCLEDAIIHCHLSLMAALPDTLIARKLGMAEAEEAAHSAQRVINAGWPRSASGRNTLEELDGWLREKGNSRNPGTTADLVTACLFVALREGSITLPARYPWRISR